MNDVGFQIHDLDGDGRNELIYCMNFEIVVVDGATGSVKYKAPAPYSNRLPVATRAFWVIVCSSVIRAALARRETSSSRTATGTCGPWMSAWNRYGKLPAAPGIIPVLLTLTAMGMMNW